MAAKKVAHPPIRTFIFSFNDSLMNLFIDSLVPYFIDSLHWFNDAFIGSLPSPSSSKPVSQQRPGSTLHAAMGYDLEKSGKKIAQQKAKPMPKRPAACLGKGTFKKPASPGKESLRKGTSNQRKPWVKLKQVDPKKNNPRSYICGMVKGGRMHLILRITKKNAPAL